MESQVNNKFALPLVRVMLATYGKKSGINNFFGSILSKVRRISKYPIKFSENILLVNANKPTILQQNTIFIEIRPLLRLLPTRAPRRWNFETFSFIKSVDYTNGSLIIQPTI